MGYAISVAYAPGNHVEGSFYGCSNWSWRVMLEDMAEAVPPRYKPVMLWFAGLYNHRTQLIWWKRARKIAAAIEAAGDFECRIASREDVMEVLAVFKEAARLKLSVELW